MTSNLFKFNLLVYRQGGCRSMKDWWTQSRERNPRLLLKMQFLLSDHSAFQKSVRLVLVSLWNRRSCSQLVSKGQRTVCPLQLPKQFKVSA